MAMSSLRLRTLCCGSGHCVKMIKGVLVLALEALLNFALKKNFYFVQPLWLLI